MGTVAAAAAAVSAVGALSSAFQSALGGDELSALLAGGNDEDGDGDGDGDGGGGDGDSNDGSGTNGEGKCDDGGGSGGGDGGGGGGGNGGGKGGGGGEASLLTCQKLPTRGRWIKFNGNYPHATFPYQLAQTTTTGPTRPPGEEEEEEGRTCGEGGKGRGKAKNTSGTSVTGFSNRFSIIYFSRRDAWRSSREVRRDVESLGLVLPAMPSGGGGGKASTTWKPIAELRKAKEVPEAWQMPER